MRRRRFSLSAILGALCLIAPGARADPEWNTGLAAGLAGTGPGAGVWPRTAFYGALRADVLWGRSARAAPGFGPSVELGTVAFDDVRAHVGASAFLPVSDLFGFLVTPAGYVRSSPVGATGGVSGRLLFGLRSRNPYGAYTPAGGLLLGLDEDLGGERTHALSVSIQIDGMLLALPVILLVSVVRGSPQD